MAKSKSRTAKIVATGLYRDVAAPKHRSLFLPRFLAAKAEEPRWGGAQRDAAHAVVVEWAKLADSNALNHKETAFDGDFLERIFGKALGYAQVPEAPQGKARLMVGRVPRFAVVR